MRRKTKHDRLLVPLLRRIYRAISNLSDLEPTEAQRILDHIRQEGKGFASKRPSDYLYYQFSYGDLFPTMCYQDGKPYQGQVYMVHKIYDLIRQFALPQEWNRNGQLGPERYIEVQVWDEPPLKG